MDNEATGAAIATGGAHIHNQDTDELLDPVLFSDDNGAFKLKTVPAFRYVCMQAAGDAMNHTVKGVMHLLISAAQLN